MQKIVELFLHTTSFTSSCNFLTVRLTFPENIFCAKLTLKCIEISVTTARSKINAEDYEKSSYKKF